MVIFTVFCDFEFLKMSVLYDFYIKDFANLYNLYFIYYIFYISFLTYIFKSDIMYLMMCQYVLYINSKTLEGEIL